MAAVEYRTVVGTSASERGEEHALFHIHDGCRCLASSSSFSARPSWGSIKSTASSPGIRIADIFDSADGILLGIFGAEKKW